MNPRLRALLGFLVILSLILWIYGYLNLLVYRTLFKVLPEDPWISFPLSVLFWVLAFAFVGGSLLERFRVSKWAAGLIWVGALWMGWTWHALLSLAVLKLLFYFMHWHGLWTDLWIAAGVTGFAAIFAGWGFWNAVATRIRRLEMVMSKKLPGGKKKVRIAVASDLHMGTIVGRSRINKLVRMIQSLKPDLILFPGDLVDADLPPVLKNNVGKALKRLNAPLGVFAVTGNHEYIGGAEPAIRYLKLHGVQVLRDEYKTLANGIVLIGREDLTKHRFTGKNRQRLTELMRGIPPLAPTILLDHQPARLRDGVKERVDLQLSGHTHHGQLFPLNLLTRMMYEKSWGYLKKGYTQIYVSCGFGTWGPPFRIGSRSEIIELTLVFK